MVLLVGARLERARNEALSDVSPTKFSDYNLNKIIQSGYAGACQCELFVVLAILGWATRHPPL